MISEFACGGQVNLRQIFKASSTLDTYNAVQKLL